jgi:hypothetical protein
MPFQKLKVLSARIQHYLELLAASRYDPSQIAAEPLELGKTSSRASVDHQFNRNPDVIGRGIILYGTTRESTF